MPLDFREKFTYSVSVKRIMAKTKAASKTFQKPPRPGKRLGVKVFGGQKVNPGNIIVRQRGSVFHPGLGVKMGKDFSIFATKKGIIRFRQLKGKKIVEVV